MFKGVKMRGRICLVTGSTSGIGKATSVELARMGATVVLVARDPDRGRAVLEEIISLCNGGSVDLLTADLSSLQEVRKLADAFMERFQNLHVLVNNAGTIFPPHRSTDEGFETTFVVNHLAQYLLTNLLLERMKASAPSRIITVSSASHRVGSIDFHRFRGENTGQGLYAGWRAYNQAKLANVLFTYELARQLHGSGVTANCLHPGMVATNAASDSKGILWALINRYRPFLTRFFLNLPFTFLKTPEQGAETSVYLASSQEVDGASGRYFVNKSPVRSSRKSYDRALAEKLWRVDSELAGLDHSGGSCFSP